MADHELEPGSAFEVALPPNPVVMVVPIQTTHAPPIRSICKVVTLSDGADTEPVWVMGAVACSPVIPVAATMPDTVIAVAIEAVTGLSCCTSSDTPPQR
ncbi:hypothetical protein [Gordonia hirsuta]|uniref:hypothetical protein n=1 Tax=Gordonia hirsuta TaxID=53427 RepID=UPI0012DC38A2|nr:hypothetical protein [Gordonia hirsuta]